MRARVDLNIGKAARKINSRIGSLVQPRLDVQVLKDSNYYAPDSTGELISSGIRASVPGSGVLIWNTVYAKDQYYNKPNKSKDKNPNAQLKWFHVAKSKNKKNWLVLANKAYRGK